MGIERSNRPVAVSRISATARRLLDASPLCAIATLAPNRNAHISTAYFAWSADLIVAWLSEPSAQHSRNIRAHSSAAVAVYDSRQTWGEADCGIQLFGTAHEIGRPAADEFAKLYAARFPEYDETELRAYRFYVLRPRRIKLFDEGEFGTGVFVTARFDGGQLAWDRTEIYRPAA